MTTKTARTWQEELSGECQKRAYSAPVYNIVSDRRGGRTAWSATVTVTATNIAARYWYDGQYLNNAKEDAAEVACTKIRNPALTTPGGRGLGPSPNQSQGGWSRSAATFSLFSMGGAGAGAEAEEEEMKDHPEFGPGKGNGEVAAAETGEGNKDQEQESVLS